MYTLTRKLSVVCLTVVLSFLVYGCGGSSKQATITDVSTDMVTAGLTPDPGTYTIQPGGTATAGDVTFACPEEGSSCEVTVADDGTVTSAGGMATAMTSASAAARLAAVEAARVAEEARAAAVAAADASEAARVAAVAEADASEAARVAAVAAADAAEAERVAAVAAANASEEDRVAAVAAADASEEARVAAVAEADAAEAARVAAVAAADAAEAARVAAVAAADASEAARVAAVAAADASEAARVLAVAAADASEEDRVAAVAAADASEADRVAAVAAADASEADRVAAVAAADASEADRVAAVAAADASEADRVAAVAAADASEADRVAAVAAADASEADRVAAVAAADASEEDRVAAVAAADASEADRVAAVAAAGIAEVLKDAAIEALRLANLRADPNAVDISDLLADYMTIPSGTYKIEPGRNMDVGDANFACPAGGLACEVIVDEEGIVVSAGGMATAQNSTAAMTTRTAIALFAPDDQAAETGALVTEPMDVPVIDLTMGGVARSPEGVTTITLTHGDEEEMNEYSSEVVDRDHRIDGWIGQTLKRDDSIAATTEIEAVSAETMDEVTVYTNIERAQRGKLKYDAIPVTETIRDRG